MTSGTDIRYTNSNGQIYVASHTTRPFYVRAYGGNPSRFFGSEKAALRYLAMTGGSLFFDYAPGCGTLIKYMGP